MTLKKRRVTSKKVSQSKYKKVKEGSSIRSAGKASTCLGTGKPRSNLKMMSTILNTKDFNSSDNSQNIVSQESVGLPSEEEEVDETDMYFDTMQERLNQNSESLSDDDISIFEGEEENKSPQDKSGEDEDVNSNGSPRNHDTSVVSSVTLGTDQYGRPMRRTYDDLLEMLQEKEKMIKHLSNKINGDEFNAVEFSCSQEKTVIETTKKFIFPCQQFLRNQDVLNDYTSRGSLGKVLMDKLDISACQRQAFWFTYKNSVRKGIKQQRCIAHNALKEKFLCTYDFLAKLLIFITFCSNI